MILKHNLMKGNNHRSKITILLIISIKNSLCRLFSMFIYIHNNTRFIFSNFYRKQMHRAMDSH